MRFATGKSGQYWPHSARLGTHGA